MTIYALRIADDTEVVGQVFNSLQVGEGRFGWSYVPTADLRELRERINESGWETLDEPEQDCYQDFLLDLRNGDHVVYINVPEWGQCTLARVTGEYEWRYEDDDFNHRFPVDPQSVRTFDRNADIVAAALSLRLKLQGRWWRIYTQAEFGRLLESLRDGTVPGYRTAETNVEELTTQLRPLFTEIAGKIQHTHPGKDLEALMERVFRSVPGVQDVRRQQGRADHGADLLVELEYGTIPGLVESRTLVVQVKSYWDKLTATTAVDDIRRAFEHYSDADMGLVVSTAERAGEKFERALEELQEESQKPVSLLIGADLAAFVLRYGGAFLE